MALVARMVQVGLLVPVVLRVGCERRWFASAWFWVGFGVVVSSVAWWLLFLWGWFPGWRAYSCWSLVA